MKPASAAGFAQRPKRFTTPPRAWLLFWFVLWWAAPLIGWAANPVSGQTINQTITHAEVSPGLVAPNQMEQGQWRPIALPHAWFRQDWCDAPVSTYRLSFDWADAGDQLAMGLLIHRAGNRIAVWLNAHQVVQFGDLHNPDADYSNLPLLAQLPWHWLTAGKNTILIQVAGDCRRFSGLSQMELGPLEPIAAQHTRDTQWVLYPIIVVVALCVLMFVASVLYAGLSPSPHARRFAWLNGIWALSTVLWSMRELPMPYALWYYCADAAYATWIMVSARITMQITATFRPWVERLQAWTLSAYFLASSLAATGHFVFLKQATMFWALLVYAFLVLRLITVCVRKPTETLLIICLTIVPMLSLGGLDSWNLWLSPDPKGYQTYYFSPIVSLIIITSCGLLMMRVFQQAMRSDMHYQHSLEQEVQRQRQELELHYQHEQEQVQNAAVQAERQRIVRDMHDGLGAQLVGMLASVRGDGLNAEHLENEIALAMEHLRDTMDNLGTTEQDLSTVLAQFRFHHAPRLARAGLHLRWRVEALPTVPWSPAAIWEMQQMLREVFANILKHAKAREITVTAGNHGGICTIRISDDGQGFDDATHRSGRGLRHLQERAQHLGLQLSVHSEPGHGTSVVWQWAENYVAGK